MSQHSHSPEPSKDRAPSIPLLIVVALVVFATYGFLAYYGCMHTSGKFWRMMG